MLRSNAVLAFALTCPFLLGCASRHQIVARADDGASEQHTASRAKPVVNDHQVGVATASTASEIGARSNSHDLLLQLHEALLKSDNADEQSGILLEMDVIDTGDPVTIAAAHSIVSKSNGARTAVCDRALSILQTACVYDAVAAGYCHLVLNEWSDFAVLKETWMRAAESEYFDEPTLKSHLCLLLVRPECDDNAAVEMMSQMTRRLSSRYFDR